MQAKSRKLYLASRKNALLENGRDRRNEPKRTSNDGKNGRQEQGSSTRLSIHSVFP